MVSQRKSPKSLASAIAAAVIAFASTTMAQAQETHPGWTPYLGCWQPVATADSPSGALCLIPSGEHVEMLTVANGVIEHREPFYADGITRAVEQEGCEGTESATFSPDRRRIYTISDLTCTDQAASHSEGIISMPFPGEWLDVRSMTVDGRSTAWAQWYERTSNDVLNELGISVGAADGLLALRGAAARATARMTINDVIEASQHVSQESVRAWVFEVGEGFAGFDTEELLRLDEAGISDEVIDVVVAVSFPRHFNLGQRQVEVAEDSRQRAGRPILLDLYAPFGYYSPLGLRNRYYGGYGGYGSYYPYPYGYNGGWSRFTPVAVEVQRADNRGGRVVAGKGYSRGGSRPGATAGQGYTRGGSSSVGSGRAGSTRSSPPPASSSRGSRKAKPKGKGKV